MYLTLLNNLIEIIIDLGTNGFNFSLYLGEWCVFSVESYFRELAIVIIAIVIMKVRKVCRL
jgi:hypothetical protein